VHEQFETGKLQGETNTTYTYTRLHRTNKYRKRELQTVDQQRIRIA